MLLRLFVRRLRGGEPRRPTVPISFIMIQVVCNLCGANSYTIRYPATLEGTKVSVAAFTCTNPGYGHHPQIVQCDRCGYVYANPRWEDDDLIDCVRGG